MNRKLWAVTFLWAGAILLWVYILYSTWNDIIGLRRSSIFLSVIVLIYGLVLEYKNMEEKKK